MSNTTSLNCWSQLTPQQVSFPFSWVGHIPFAMWLVCVCRPKKFVELGTHSGNSYLAICQAVKQGQLSTRCYAVDTWQGDEHAGHYNNDVYQMLKSNHDEAYGGFSTLLRMTFDEALAHIDDRSVDLLHIDGLHTYEAVKHDFETWLPKLCDDAIILFHDIAVKERGFGVYAFWQEIKQRYSFTISFEHSNGLGVLFLQRPKSIELVNLLDRSDNTIKATLKTRFETLGNQLIFHSALNSIDAALAVFPSQRATLAELFDSQVHYSNLQQIELDRLLTEHMKAQELIEQQNTYVKQLEQDHHELVRLKNSRSWRITAPLRHVGQQLRQTKLRSAWKMIKGTLDQLQSNSAKTLVKRIYGIWLREGWSGLLQRFKKMADPLRDTIACRIDEDRYSRWIIEHDQPLTTDQINRKLAALSTTPIISVVMPVYNPPLDLLEAAITSVQQQSYPHWQLCIADDVSPNPEVRDFLTKCTQQDPRIHVIFRSENGHISAASNSALMLATGDFVALLDHDDLLAADALLWVAETINQHPKSQIIYSDEDKIDASGQRFDPYFKSDWNYELFLSQNMISHLGVYRHSLLKNIQGFREGYEGSQDYDLALRCLQHISAEDVIHIPKVLYHWRVLPGSTAMGLDEKPYAQQAGEHALNDYLKTSGLGGWAESLPKGGYRIHAPLPQPLPLVSLIIPTRNAAALVKACITSILDKTTYANYEILLIDNGSDNEQALSYFSQLNEYPNIRVIRDDRPFNYSALNNAAVAKANGTIIGLINNDIEVITPDWLEEMVSLALRPGVGAVGAKLWYPDKRLQHGGVIVGLGGVAGHAHYLIGEESAGYFGRASLTQQFSAVTAACLLVQKAHYQAVGGLDEENLTVAFNDVDFCLKLQAAGYRNLWTPFAELYHHESVSRGLDDTPEKRERFITEVRYMEQRWPKEIARDPYYHPSLSLETMKQFQLN